MSFFYYDFICNDNLVWTLCSDQKLPFSEKKPGSNDASFYLMSSFKNAMHESFAKEKTCYLFNSSESVSDWHNNGGIFAVSKLSSRNDLLGIIACMVQDYKRKTFLESLLFKIRKEKNTLNFLPISFSIRRFDDCKVATDILHVLFSKKIKQDMITPVHELLLNAIEHGTLSIKNSKKKEMIKSPEFYNNLLCLLNQPKNQNKCIYIVASIVLINQKPFAKISIEDEGDGFDWKNINAINDQSPCGRGMLIVKSMVDDLIYNSSGNKVDVMFEMF
ncbi:MAG: hypothetical protein HEEMFOPI_00963 [Holosporales bacterium]